jgi:hypothetical protein
MRRYNYEITKNEVTEFKYMILEKDKVNKLNYQEKNSIISMRYFKYEAEKYVEKKQNNEKNLVDTKN